MIGKNAFKGHKGFVFAFAAAFLSAASLAWACTPATTVQMTENSGPAGTLVTISGTSAVPEKALEIRWNSANGALLGTAQGSEFAVAVNVPADAAPGVYYMVVDGKARDTFVVSGPAVSAAPKALSEDLWSGFGGDTGSALNGAELAANGQAPAPSSSLPLGLGLAAAGAGGLVLSSLILIKRRSRALSR